MTPEDGTGVPGADTYVDPTSQFATDYIAASLYADAWTAADSARRRAAVIQASRTLDSVYDWQGTRLTDDQGLDWPRSGVIIEGKSSPVFPLAIQQATMEQAMALLDKNRLNDAGGAEQGISGLTIGSGAVELKFASDPAAAPVTMIPPIVDQILRKYKARSGGRFRCVTRSY